MAELENSMYPKLLELAQYEIRANEQEVYQLLNNSETKEWRLMYRDVEIMCANFCAPKKHFTLPP